MARRRMTMNPSTSAPPTVATLWPMPSMATRASGESAPETPAIITTDPTIATPRFTRVGVRASPSAYAARVKRWNAPYPSRPNEYAASAAATSVTPPESAPVASTRTAGRATAARRAPAGRSKAASVRNPR